MADVSNIRTNWQAVTYSDWQSNTPRAVNNQISPAELNRIGQAIIDINGELATPDYGDLPVGATLTLWYNNGWPPRPTSRTSVIVQWCSVDYQGIPPTAIPGIDFLKVMEYQSIPDPDPDPDPTPTGNVLALATLEGLVDGAIIADSGDFTALNPGTATLRASAAAAIHGSMGMRATDEAQSRVLAWTNPQPEAVTRVIDFHFIIRAISGNTYIAGMRDTVAGENRCDIRINGDRSVTCRSGGVASGSSAEDVQLQTLTPYRCEWWIDPVGQRVRIYDMNNDEYVMDFEGALANALGDQYQVGAPVAYGVSTVIDFDTLRVGDDWLVPYV